MALAAKGPGNSCPVAFCCEARAGFAFQGHSVHLGVQGPALHLGTQGLVLPLWGTLGRQGLVLNLANMRVGFGLMVQWVALHLGEHKGLLCPFEGTWGWFGWAAVTRGDPVPQHCAAM